MDVDAEEGLMMAKVIQRHQDAATRALEFSIGKRPVMQEECDCCGYHYDQEHARLSQALADYEAEKNV